MGALTTNSRCSGAASIFASHLSWDTYSTPQPPQQPQTTLLLSKTLGENFLQMAGLFFSRRLRHTGREP